MVGVMIGSGVRSFYFVMDRIGVILLGCLNWKRRVYWAYIRCIDGIFDSWISECDSRLL